MQGIRARHILLRVIAVVVLIQLAQFFVADIRHRDHNQAIHRYDTADIIEISLRDDANPRSRYSIWVALAELAPHSTVWVPAQVEYRHTHRIYGFGRAAVAEVVQGRNSGLEADEDFFLEYVVAAGPGAHRGPPWMIALDPDNGQVGDPVNPDDFLPLALAAGTRGSALMPGRELVLVRWRELPAGDPGASYYDYYNILIETSLLSDELSDMYLPDGSGR